MHLIMPSNNTHAHITTYKIYAVLTLPSFQNIGLVYTGPKRAAIKKTPIETIETPTAAEIARNVTSMPTLPALEAGLDRWLLQCRLLV